MSLKIFLKHINRCFYFTVIYMVVIDYHSIACRIQDLKNPDNKRIYSLFYEKASFFLEKEHTNGTS